MDTLLITENEFNGNRSYDVLIAADIPAIHQTTQQLSEFLKGFKLSCTWERSEKEGKYHPNAPAFFFHQVHSFFGGGKVKTIEGCDPLTGINQKSFHFALIWTMRVNGWTIVTCDEASPRQWTFQREIDSDTATKIAMRSS